MTNSLLLSWQQLPGHIDPIVFSIGFFSVRWYSLMYLAAFGTVFFLLRYRIRKDYPNGLGSMSAKVLIEKIPDFLVWSIFALLIGARLGYVLFYQPSIFLTPWQIINPFSNGTFTGISGMSYHGGLIGILLATSWWLKRNRLSFVSFTDLLIPTIPLGYMWGRLGNFLNGELYGTPTDGFSGMYFPTDTQQMLRHPSQLYEALGEGVLIFAILWPLRNKPWLNTKFLPLYLLLYGVIRFIIEYFRAPDAALALGLTRGQWLCLAMIIVGGMIIILSNKKSLFEKIFQ